MHIFLNVIVVLQMLAALVMIGLVLIQHGKGADMGASFGSGASGSLFGATGSANFLSRSTAVCAAVFFVCTLSLAYFSNERARPATAGSVLDRPAAASASVPAAPAASAAPTGAARIPGVAPAAPLTLPAAASCISGGIACRVGRGSHSGQVAKRHPHCLRRSGHTSAIERGEYESQVESLAVRSAIPQAIRAHSEEHRRRGEIGRHAILRG